MSLDGAPIIELTDEQTTVPQSCPFCKIPTRHTAGARWQKWECERCTRSWGLRERAR